MISTILVNSLNKKKTILVNLIALERTLLQSIKHFRKREKKVLEKRKKE